MKSETSDTYTGMPIGSSSTPQGGILSSSAYRWMPTGHTVSMATGTLSQTQDGAISSIQGLMMSHQTLSSVLVGFLLRHQEVLNRLLPKGWYHLPTVHSYHSYVSFSGQGTHFNIVSEPSYPVSQHYLLSHKYWYFPNQLRSQTPSSPAFPNSTMQYSRRQTLQYAQSECMSYPQSQVVQYAPLQQAPQTPPQYQPTQPIPIYKSVHNIINKTIH